MVEIEFDVAKDRVNRAKHGLSLSFAGELNWDLMLLEVDDRHEYGEERWLGITRARTRVYAVVFTIRHSKVRVISLRRASNREIRRYETQVND